MATAQFRIKLSQDKQATCCSSKLKTGSVVDYFWRESPNRIMIGVRYDGTCSMHKIKMRTDPFRYRTEEPYTSNPYFS